MLDKITGMFTLNSPNALNPQVWACAAVIWVVVVACALFSIWSRPFSRQRKLFWAAIVICVPLLGLLAYLPFSVNEELFPYIGFWRKPRM